MKTKITKLDKPTVTYIRKRLKAAVKPLAKELGVVIDLGHCTFQTSNCRFQLKVAVLDSNGYLSRTALYYLWFQVKEPEVSGHSTVWQWQRLQICLSDRNRSIG